MRRDPHWIDKLTAAIAPRWTLQRQRARVAADLLARHYEAASVGRRTQAWRRSAGDGNAVVGPALATLRDVARDLVRNNPYAESAVSTIVDHTVGWGLVAKAQPRNAQQLLRWKAWAESTDCDADGRHDFYGLQKLVLRTVVESGEVLVRRRWRRSEDGYALPMQLQVLEPDHLDTNKNATLANGAGEIIQGVEFDPLGRRAAYWLFPKHPGATSAMLTSSLFSPSRRIPAEDVLHIFRATRAGQVRAVTWFAPVMLRMKDLDEYEDATLMKQKIAACLAVIMTDVDGTGTALGSADDTDNPGIDSLEPGGIIQAPAGRNIEVVEPPTVGEYDNYVKNNLRAIATGLHVTYEDLTGDFSNVNFSSARMARLKHWARVDDWRWRLLIPQFCVPAWTWAAEAMRTVGLEAASGSEWSAPPMPMIEPDKEGLAIMRNVRAGIQTLPDALRERGYDPDDFLEEYAKSNTDLDRLGILLDSDPRRMTQAGQIQGTASPTPPGGATA